MNSGQDGKNSLRTSKKLEKKGIKTMGFFDKVEYMGLFDKKDTKIPPEVAEWDKYLSQLEENRKVVIYNIGAKYIQNNKPEDAIGTVYEAEIKELARLEAEKALTEKRKLAVQGLRQCEHCGAILVLDSLFCNKCGQKLENEQEVEKVEPIIEQNVCSQCGTSYEEGAIFCTSCGNRSVQEN